MSVTVGPVETMFLTTRRHLMVVVAHDVTQIAARRSQLGMGLGLPELTLLQQLGTRGVAESSLDELVDETVRQVGGDREALHRFVAAARRRAVLQGHDRPPADEAVAEPVVREADPPARFVVPVPLILEVSGGWFVTRDHDGAVTCSLDAAEVAALRALVEPRSVDEAIMAQALAMGDNALDHDRALALFRKLAGGGVVLAIDESTPSALRRHDRSAEEERREELGRSAVSRAIQVRMAEYDRIERERRAATGTKRARIFPVHAIATAWRNPPLSLGLILSYVEAYGDGRLGDSYDVRPDWLVTLDRVGELVADDPAIFFFSNYVWSSEQNLAISAKVKELSPGSLTVHGGPDVPKYQGDVEAYFAANPHVDVTVRGEGEVTTAEMLDALSSSARAGELDLSVLADVPGLCYRDGDRVVRTADRDRMTELDIIPSPYLTGLFDGYAEGWREIAESGVTGLDSWSYQLPVAVLETNRGCPYGCTFCDWGSATNSRIRKFSLDRIYDELDWCAENQVETVGLADANFGIFERDVDITRRVAELKTTRGWPRQFGTNYAKNTVKHLKQIVELLTDADILGYGLLSLQSMDADTLSTIERSNIKIEKYEDLAREFRNAKLPLYVDLMVGLPGQTVQSFRNDLQECINREIHAKVFQTQLLVNSPMNEPEYRERHGITAKPGALVIQAESFTQEDYERMLDLRIVFFVAEKFGTLRHLARYVRQETGIQEMDLFERMYDESRSHPARWPVLEFTLGRMFKFMVPPISWRLFVDEARRFLVEVLGMADDATLATAIEVQHAMLPERNRTFPHTVVLEHDFVAWHQAMIEAKESGHLDDWTEHVPPLRSYGPGTLVVDDPRSVCTHEMGRRADSNPWDAWDLESPISRAVMRANE